MIENDDSDWNSCVSNVNSFPCMESIDKINEQCVYHTIIHVSKQIECVNHWVSV